jgi:hypothetical protein
MLQPFGYSIFKTYEDDDYEMQPVAGFNGEADYLFVPSEKAHVLMARDAFEGRLIGLRDGPADGNAKE